MKNKKRKINQNKRSKNKNQTLFYILNCILQDLFANHYCLDRNLYISAIDYIVQGKSRYPIFSLLHPFDFCLPPYHTFGDINSLCLPMVLLTLPSVTSSLRIRSISAHLHPRHLLNLSAPSYREYLFLLTFLYPSSGILGTSL